MNASIPMSNLPPVARAEMARIGPIWGRDIEAHREIVFDTYLPLLRAVADRGLRVTRDIGYGSHDRQKLDVYQPEGARGAPVVMFVHGGAFIRGAKDLSDQIYSNVPRYFAGKGLVGINVGYRLAPEAPYPEGSRMSRARLRGRCAMSKRMAAIRNASTSSLIRPAARMQPRISQIQRWAMTTRARLRDSSF